MLFTSMPSIQEEYQRGNTGSSFGTGWKAVDEAAEETARRGKRVRENEVRLARSATEGNLNRIYE
jgi:hypothetical protein